MKICWDNLEEIRYIIKSGTFRRKGHTLYYYESCMECGDPFLGGKNSIYCDPPCRNKSEINRNKISKASSGVNNGFYNKKHKKETIERISKNKKGKGHPHTEETKKKMRESQKRGKDHPMYGKHSWNWDGGYSSNDIPKYNLYAPQLEPYEECRRSEKDPKILEVKCTYCGKWYTPNLNDVNNRLGGIKGTDTHRFYCSPGCKQECPIYRRVKYSADHPKSKRKQGLNTEVPPEFRQMVFARDNHTCQRCGSTKSLHCHHIIPKKLSPMEIADLGNGITFCKHCHKWVHKNIKGCGYRELADHKC